jgi:hypothetical protein
LIGVLRISESWKMRQLICFAAQTIPEINSHDIHKPEAVCGRTKTQTLE